MKDEFTRTAMLIGENAVEHFSSARVAVFGIGGVGGFVAEALARSGIGLFDLIDSDTVNITNIQQYFPKVKCIQKIIPQMKFNHF